MKEGITVVKLREDVEVEGELFSQFVIHDNEIDAVSEGISFTELFPHIGKDLEVFVPWWNVQACYHVAEGWEEDDEEE